MSNTAAGNGQFPVANPTLLESNSDSMGVSDSSNSPQTPQTPRLYGRMRPRYPQELGRVPLHRRGTSKTYERLEDLLKEAGYKETRIFTPEAERTGKCEDDDDDATVVEDKRTSMVKDVVGFLAGLIPGAGASVAVAESLGSKVLDPSTGSQTRGTKNPQPPSPPFSPLTNKASLPPLSRHDQRAHHVDPHPTQSEHPQIVIHPTTPLNQAHGHHQSYQGPPSHPHKQHPVQKPHGQGIIPGSNIQLAPPHITTNLHSPRPSRATAYLRHMASAPNVISKRPNSTPVDLSHAHQSKSRLRVSLNEVDSHEKLKPQGDDKGGNGQQPPLPTSWLETVARAVLFGGAGAHVGGPLGSHQLDVDSNHERRASPLRQLRPSRSSLSQVSHKSRYYSHHQHRSKKSPMLSGLSDSTNFSPSTATSSAFLTPGLPSPMPPALFAQIERGRADRCISEVSRTRVMCRSAPGSRSGSVVRSEGMEIGVEKNRRKNLDVEREVEMQRDERGRNRGVKRRGAGGGWLKGRDKEILRVPSLARMHVEGDVWSSNMKTRKRGRPESGFVVGNPGFGKGKAGCTSESEVVEYESFSDESEEDEEEGELNLARMLVPPKRQNSIKSLRKHLLASVADSGGSGAHSKLRRVHHLASAGKKGGEGRFRRQTSHPTSLARNNTDEEREDDPSFWQDTRRNTGVLSPDGRNLKSRNQPQALNAPLARWDSGNSEDRKRKNSCSDDEDVDSFAGFFDVGSGRSTSTSGRRRGIGSVWGAIGSGAG